MSHMVIYRGADGKPGYHQTEDIHDAIGFVEQIRNEQGVEQARIFRLEEVVFEYRPYFRVQIAAGESGNGQEITNPAVVEIPINDAGGSPSEPGETFRIAAPDVDLEEIDSGSISSTSSVSASNGSRRGLFGR